MATPTYNQTTQDIGNIVALEHVNVTVPDLELAALFYVSGLGFTRDRCGRGRRVASRCSCMASGR